MIYSSVIISILIHGSECWSMKDELYSRLSAFHHKCARIMCQITINLTIKHHIKITELLNQLGIRSITDYYHTRLLRWAGHVARMDFSRSPRKLLTDILAHNRLTVRPLKTFGQTLTKVLKNYEINTTTWMAVAQDRHQ
jgi:hypothetical protein